MKKYTTSCKDNETGLEIILSECSFNQACSFLEGQDLGKYLGCGTAGSTIKIKYEKRIFTYDGKRGYLLGI